MSVPTDPVTARQIALDPSAPPAYLEVLEGINAEVDLLLAGHASATASLLLSLSRHWQPAVREAVAANPSCPPSLVQAIGLRHPSAVLRNPQLPEFIAAQQDFLDGLHVLQHGACPREWLAWKAEH